MYALYPVFYFLNAFGTHQYLSKHSSVYKQSSYSIQQEILGRWNNSLTQLYIVAAVFSQGSESVEQIANLFTIYFFTDIIHMLFYCSDWIYYVHHTIPIFVHLFLWNFFSYETKVAIIYTSGLLEITTPPISLVWTLSKLQKKGWYTPYLAALTYLNFLCIRILYFPYIWYTHLPTTVQILSFPYHFMNILWFQKMTMYLLKQGGA